MWGDPFDSHIVLVAENFPRAPQSWITGDPNTLSLGITPSPIDSSVLNIFAIVSTLPALLGIIIYSVMWIRERQAIKKQASSAPGILQTHATSGKVTSTEQPMGFLLNQQPPLLEHQNFFIPIQLMIARPFSITEMHTGKSASTSFDREIRKSIRGWKQTGELFDVVALAAKLLVEDINAWDNLAEELQKDSSSLSLPDAWSLEQQGLKAMLEILDAKDDETLRLYCGKALVYYTRLLPLPILPHHYQAAIRFDMGLAYMFLASVDRKVILELLQHAQKYYREASEIYQKMGDLRLHMRTLIALGDVSFTFYKLPDEKFRPFLLDASDKYTRAHKIMNSYFSPETRRDSNIRQQEIYSRLELERLLPEISRVLEERILAIYLNDLLVRIPPMSVNH